MDEEGFVLVGRGRRGGGGGGKVKGKKKNDSTTTTVKQCGRVAKSEYETDEGMSMATIISSIQHTLDKLHHNIEWCNQCSTTITSLMARRLEQQQGHYDRRCIVFGIG